MTDPIVIRRYGGDRLYEAAARRYVTVAMLRAWNQSGVAFVVLDAATGADVTRVLLA
jgi:polyhydroxyalkanoate synthesis regulator protein